MSARAKISIPQEVHFSTQIQVRISDLNYGNHLANDKVLTLMHEARVQFLRKYNQTEIQFFDLGLIQADTVIIYKQQAFLGDLLTFDLSVADLSKVGVNIYYKITKEKQEIARAKTNLAFFDYSKQKLVLLSARTREFFQTLLSL